MATWSVKSSAGPLCQGRMCPEVVQSDSALDHTCLEELQESWMDIVALVLEPTKEDGFKCIMYYITTDRY